jgi:peptidoglycan/LPS O-acetylase OafA/YrhL
MTPSLLSDVTRRDANALNFLRLIFACMVIISHSFPLGYGLPDPAVPSGSLGAIAVDGFFLLSGFLIARSWKRTGSLALFLWHRFLRIMPALWACLLVTAFVIGPAIALAENVSLTTYLTTWHDGPWSYAPANAAVAVRQVGISGILTDVPYPITVNGSLWTLWWECLCYALVAALGVAGLLGRTRILLTLLVATWIACVVAAHNPTLFPMAGSIYGPSAGAFLLLPFLVGVGIERYANCVPLHGKIAGVAIAIAGCSLFADGVTRAVLLPFTLTATAYTYFWLSVRARRIRIGAKHDLSYGVYIYAFPIQQLLATTAVPRFGVGVFTATAVALTLAAAYGSWELVESRALARKSRLPTWLQRRARLPFGRTIE